MKTFAKCALAATIAAAVLAFSAFAAYFAVTNDVKLDTNKLINYGQSITFYDTDGNKIDSSSLIGNRSSVGIKDLPDHVKNAFIASEDRKFYSHGGLDVMRILKAAYKNISSLSFKEGASTISQQLIKNTHLSNDKTIVRKLKEIRLAGQLEKKYSKDEILEMYLNTIYFGHSCYGLQSAARFYFDTDAEQLTLAQGAALAGLLSSPNNYSPFKNAEKCLQRRDIVLENMLKCELITQNEYNDARSQPLGAIAGGNTRKRGDYIRAVTEELEELNLNCYTDLAGCSVYTYMTDELQDFIENLAFENDSAVIITDSENGVCAYTNTTGGIMRQPGSAIKPLLVYAPAIEEKKIHTFTKIVDERANFGGYSPENHDKKYHGAVTVQESLAKSYNIPAVKILNGLTVARAAEYAKKLNVTLDEEDKNLSLALGGMKHGTTLKALCDGYTTFRRNGMYSPSRFIKKITDKNGNVIYCAPENKRRVFCEGTCSLMNEMLMQTAKNGTAKKLKNISFDIAAKTGTVGDESGNTDAYAIGYTAQNTIAVWTGDKNNKKYQISGGGICCQKLKEIAEKIYKDKKPAKLDVASGTKVIEIDRGDYQADGRIVLADGIAPKLNKLQVKCLKNNIPTQKSDKFSHPSIKKPTIIVDNSAVSIVLCKTYYYSYLIKRNNNVVYDGEYLPQFRETLADGIYNYSVTPYYSFGGKKYFGKTERLGNIIIGSSTLSQLPPPITRGDWFN